MSESELGDLGDIKEEKQSLGESRERVANLQFAKEVHRVKQSPEVYERDMRAMIGSSTRDVETYETEGTDRVLVIEDVDKDVNRTEITYDASETTPENVLKLYTDAGGGARGTLMTIVGVLLFFVVVGFVVHLVRQRRGGSGGGYGAYGGGYGGYGGGYGAYGAYGGYGDSNRPPLTPPPLPPQPPPQPRSKPLLKKNGQPLNGAVGKNGKTAKAGKKGKKKG